MTSIQIENLRLRTIIGVNEWEKDNLQDVVISVRFTYNAQRAEKSDRIEDAADYKSLTKKIIKEVEASKFNLIESLASHIFKVVKESGDLKNVQVKVEKPQALRFCDNVIAIKTDDDK